MSNVFSSNLSHLSTGGRKRDAVEALIMKRGAEQGLGRGFLSSSLFNWRAVINVCGPLLFGMLYSFGAKRRVPGLGKISANCMYSTAITRGLASIPMRSSLPPRSGDCTATDPS